MRTPQQAQNLIRRHLQNNSNTPVVLNQRIVQYWWSVLNSAVFDNYLHPPIAIRVINTVKHKYWGECVGEGQDSNGYYRSSLKINNKFITRRMFLDILVHEMVHSWEYQTKQRMSHHVRFKQWKPIINERTTLSLSPKVREDLYR